MGYARSNVYRYIKAAAQQYLKHIIERSGSVTRAILLKAVEFSRSSKVSLSLTFLVQIPNWFSPPWLETP